MPDKSSPFGGKMRVRVNGLIFRGESVLLVKNRKFKGDEPFWIPPGGGLEFGETLHQALVREVLEETHLQVKSASLWYVSEYVQPPWHAVEFYFHCSEWEGDVVLGSDPELSDHDQLLQAAEFVPLNDLHNRRIIPAYLLEHLAIDVQAGRSEPLYLPQNPV